MGMSMGAKSEYLKSLRAKALLADAKAASMLQLEEVCWHYYCHHRTVQNSVGMNYCSSAIVV